MCKKKSKILRFSSWNKWTPIFELSYVLDNNLWNNKKDMIVLVHENHDKWPNVTPVQHFCSGFDHANRVLAVVPNIYQKLDSVMCIV